MTTHESYEAALAAEPVGDALTDLVERVEEALARAGATRVSRATLGPVTGRTYPRARPSVRLEVEVPDAVTGETRRRVVRVVDLPESGPTVFGLGPDGRVPAAGAPAPTVEELTALATRDLTAPSARPFVTNADYLAGAELAWSLSGDLDELEGSLLDPDLLLGDPGERELGVELVRFLALVESGSARRAAPLELLTALAEGAGTRDAVERALRLLAR